MTARRTFLSVLAALAFLFLITALVLTWAVTSPSGLRFAVWMAETALGPQLVVEAPEGTLLGPLRIGRLVSETKERRIEVENLSLEWQAPRLLDGLLLVKSLRVGRLLVASRPRDDAPEPPADLTVPVAVQVDEFRIDEVRLGEVQGSTIVDGLDFSAISGRLASDGQRHRLDELRLSTARMAAEGNVTLDGQAPLALTGSARLTGEELGRPITVTLEANGNLTDQLTLSARSNNPALDVEGEASLAVFAKQALVRGHLTVNGLNPATWVDGAPHARLDIEATAVPETNSPQNVAGEVEIVNRQPGRLDEERIPLRRLQARFRQVGGSVLLPEFTAQLTRGEVSGSGRWADGEFTADTQLARVDAGAWHSMLKNTRLGGKLTARLSATTQTVRAELRDPGFGLDIAATHSAGHVQIERARLAARGGSMEVSGHLVPGGEYELRSRVQDFDPAFFANVPGGRLNATLEARGQLGAPPTMDLHFVLRDSVLAGRPLAGQGDIVLQPDRLQQADFTLRAGDNRVEAHGQLGRPDDRLNLRIDAPRLEQVGLGGALTGTVTLAGQLRAPGAEWALKSPRFVVPGKADLGNLVSDGRWEPDGLLRAALTVGRLTVGDTIPPLSQLSFRVDGRQSAHRVDLSARIGSEGAVQAGGNGGFGAARAWSGEIETLAWQGRHAFHLVDRTRLDIAPGRLALSQATVTGEQWRATIDTLRWSPERLQTSGRFGNLPALLLLPQAAPSSTLRLGGDWNIDFAERTDGRMRVFRERGDLMFRVGEETLSLGLERLDFNTDFSGRQAELSVNASGTRAGNLRGRLTASLRPGDGGWTLARNVPWQGDAHLDVPSIAWLSSLAGENVRLGGRLNADLRLAGTPAAPQTTGQASGSELQLRLLDYGLDLGGGTLRLDLTPETVRLQRLEMTSVATQRPHGGRFDFKRLTAQAGRLSAEGELVLGSGDSRIELRADRLPVAQLPDRWVMLSGTGGARFAGGRVTVNGDLRADAAYVELAAAGQPTLSADVVVLSRETARPARPAPTPSRLGLDLKLDLGENFYFRGAGIESRLAGAVRLAANNRDQWRGTGSVHTVGGTFDAYGRELSIERGILNFNGLVTEPGLNVRAVRKNLPVEAGVEVTGTLSDPQVRLVSVPEVPDAEKLSWMVLGRPPNKTLGGQDADLLLSAAMALRSNQGKGPLQSLMQGFGLEELSLTSGTLEGQSSFPTSGVAGSFAQGSNATVTEQIATVGKRIGTNTVLSYERSLASAENVVKLTHELTRGLSLIGRVGASSTISLLYTFAFGGSEAVKADSGENNERR